MLFWKEFKQTVKDIFLWVYSNLIGLTIAVVVWSLLILVIAFFNKLHNQKYFESEVKAQKLYMVKICFNTGKETKVPQCPKIINKFVNEGIK